MTHSLQPYEIWGQRGWPSVEVVGESFYNDAIRGLFGRQVNDYGQELAALSTQLVHDPTNRHDSNAVGVWISGSQVGNLSREDAARYAPHFAALQMKGFVAQTTARVWGGMRDDFDEPPKFVGSVTVDLPEPHMMTPANEPPREPHRVLPPGSAIQVSGEEQHMDALTRLHRQEGSCWAYVTIHELVEERPRSSKSVAEIRINGAKVGQLTPKMSMDILPVAHHLQCAGLTTAARAIVKGNRLKMEVVLYTPRAHELPDSWLDELDANRGDDVAPAEDPVEPRSVGQAPDPPAAGWYADPDASGKRWWDGRQWTAHKSP